MLPVSTRTFRQAGCRGPYLALALLMPVLAAAPAALAAERTAVGTFGAWSVACDAAAPRQACDMTQRVAADPEGRKVVLGVTLALPADSSKPRISFRLSPGAYREAGAAIKIDDHKPIRAPITGCDANVCEVQAWLDPDVVAWMKAGKLLQFAYFLDRERQATFPVSLNGFERAFAALRERR